MNHCKGRSRRKYVQRELMKSGDAGPLSGWSPDPDSSGVFLLGRCLSGCGRHPGAQVPIEREECRTELRWSSCHEYREMCVEGSFDARHVHLTQGAWSCPTSRSGSFDIRPSKRPADGKDGGFAVAGLTTCGNLMESIPFRPADAAKDVAPARSAEPFHPQLRQRGGRRRPTVPSTSWPLKSGFWNMPCRCGCRIRCVEEVYRPFRRCSQRCPSLLIRCFDDARCFWPRN